MIIKNLLHWSMVQLNSSIEAMALLMHATQRSSASLLANNDTCLDPGQGEEFMELIKKRKDGVPIAYITGHREFWSIDFKINENVFIPRHETELVVERVLARLIEFPFQKISVLDLGTGSGAIALSIANENSYYGVTGTDISQLALDLAERNKKNLQLSNIRFSVGDWYSSVIGNKFDVIVSNPPYIDSNDDHLNQGDLRYEPKKALVSSDNGFAELRYIVSMSQYFFKSMGWLLLEHGYDQGMEVRSMMHQFGFNRISTYRDLSNNERVSEAQFLGEN